MNADETAPEAPVHDDEESQLAREMGRRATTPIRLALAFIYFHFGFLKFFPDLSSAEMLSTQTVLRLRLGIDAHTSLYLLAIFEVLLGLMLVIRVPMRVVFPPFLLHMAGTFAPLFLLPELTFKFAPFAPTLEGQYILKNVILLAAGWTLYRSETQTVPTGNE